MPSAQKPAALKNKIFIVYTSHEEKIAEYLKKLLDLSGYIAFFCRQKEERKGLALGSYITDLRDNLDKADLVIFILSQEFQWSKYAQAEIGATMVKGTPRIVLIIPPAKREEVRKIAPMLEDHESIVADLVDQEGFFDDLRLRLNDTLMADNGQALANIRILKKAQQELWGRIKGTIQDYELNLPQRIEVRVWDSIQEGTPAQWSIVENIKNSLRAQSELTQLVFVGVSLKFSLALISRALEEFAREVKQARGSRKGSKSLKITLIYMDDLAHILHTLKDFHDIDTIRGNLNKIKEWIEEWKKHCEEASISLGEVIPKRIDYIPPRVGILIDSEKLYAGQCYFAPAGTAEPGRKMLTYRLLVGERNYFYYTNEDDRGKAAIRDFKASIDVYSDPKHNGVMLALDPAEWMDRLRACIETYEDIKEITLISETCTKFESLITAALRVGSDLGVERVKIYVRNPDASSVSKVSRNRITALPQRIQGGIRHGSSSGRAGVEIYYYSHEPTFRAALLGNAVLGVQMYERRQDNSGDLVLQAGSLRIIAARYSGQFKELKEMVDRFLLMRSVDDTPHDII